MASEKHLLIIRLSAMGDVAMTVPVLLALKEQHPSVKITILTRAFFKPLFSQIPNVKVYEADVKGKHKGIVGLYKLYQELKSLKIDIVADLHNVLRSKILKLFFNASGVAVAQIDKGRKEKKALTAKTKKKFIPLKTTHQRYADVFEQLGFKIDLLNVTLLKKELLSEKTQELIGNDAKKIIGIAPFAAFSGKMYPLSLMEQVVENLATSGSYKLFLFGGGAREIEILNRWENTFSNTISVAGKISFDQELAIISHLNIMLAMDSGNAHLAANYGIITITLWGVTHPYAGFYPFGQNIQNALLADKKQFPLIPTSVYGNKFPEGYGKAMETITPASVITKIDELLKV